MPEVIAHKPGTPSWVELAATDEKAALAFYSALFGWKDNPQPMGPGEVYHMMQLRGLEVSAIYTQRADERSMGIPPHWSTYFSVASADDTAAKAKQAGATVMAEPFDVFDVGRMAVIQDPQGAVFCVWQAKQHIGARLIHEPGAFTWAEVRTTDARKASAFYTKVLGVSAEKAPGMDYTLLKVGGQETAGILQITKEMGPMPPHWAIFFAVADVDASAKKAASLGATVTVPPQDIPNVGRFSALQDPQGAHFNLYKSTRPQP